MADRSEIIEAALDSFPEGIALLSHEGQVAFWNRAAEKITGFPSMEIVARTIPCALKPLLLEDDSNQGKGPCSGPRPEHAVLIRVQHKLGSDLAEMVRSFPLRGSLGERIGKAILFRPADCLGSMPFGETSEESSVEETQADLEEWIETAYREFKQRNAPMGLLWITVDQAHELRKTHGAKACEAMLDRIARTLAKGLKPAEQLGRWGDDEFLVLSHEASPGMLAAHAQVLAGLARTSEYLWWGDRVSFTVSIGAAQAELGERLVQLLERAQAAMLTSVHAGGNHITLAPERQA
jgi:diguanylate cyclase (GGDEF)-like protein/PAS domain S-box-containing protein